MDMLALGFAEGLLDMGLVVHSDHWKRNRPAREARALECIGVSGARRGAPEQHQRTGKHTMPEHLIVAEVDDATTTWWNVTSFMKPRSAHRWARLWGNHTVRDRECPIP